MFIHSRPIKIGIVVGESSGDILGAGLMHALKKYLKEVYFFGIGGPKMQSENMESWYDIQELSVMGIIELFMHFPKLIMIRKNLIKRFYKLNPDVFIGIDSPDFNITLEKKLKKRGISTIHYVSPSIWAWRTKRIFNLKQATDNILVLLPFEKKIYDYFDIPCQFIGHTLADKIPLYPNKIYARQKLGIADDVKCLAILPGSRMQEIKMITHNFLVCVQLLIKHFPNLEVLVPLNNLKNIKQFTKIASNFPSIKLRILSSQAAWEIMTAADIALLSSGTATLECMLSKCPMVVAYRMNSLTFLLLKQLIKTPWISLPNLLSGYNLVQEFIQNNCRPEKLATTLIYLLNNHTQRTILQKKFYQLHRKIKCNADIQAAHAVLKLIKLKKYNF